MPFWPIRLFLPPNLPSATPTFNISREWNTGNIGVVSSFLGLNAGFRKKIIQLFDLGYASRLRLIFCISAGFFLCHIFISYVPTVEIIVEADGEQDLEEDEEEVETILKTLKRKKNRLKTLQKLIIHRAGLLYQEETECGLY